MKRPAGKIETFSESSVGHMLTKGWVLVDASGNTIDAEYKPVVRGTTRQFLEVYDPGQQYAVCFEFGAPASLAKVSKPPEHKRTS